MSVINKMLKDLEERHDDTELNEFSSVYQPPSKSYTKYIVAGLGLVIVTLLIAISLLLFDRVTPTLTAKLNAVSAGVDDAQPKPKIIVKPLKSATNVDADNQPNLPKETNSTVVDKQIESLIAEVLTEQNSQAQKRQTPTKKMVAAQNNLNNSELKNKQNLDLQASKAVTPKPAQQVVEKPSLTIIKSSEQYSPEQRLELLMKKAQSSFDKGYISEAVEKLNQVLAISDGHIAARNLLAVSWYGRGELQQAVTILNDGLSKYPNVEEWRMTAAKIYFKENKIDGAFSYLDIELDSGSVEFYSMKASVARKLEHYASAETAYLMLTKLQPDIGHWWLGYAISLDSQEKFDVAILAYQTVLNKGGVTQSSMKFVANRIQELKQ